MAPRALKSLLKRYTPRLIRRSVARLGGFYAAVDEPPRLDRFPSQEATFRALEHLGWSPRACIDVGAYHGEWAGMFLDIFPNSRVLMIEAQAGKKPILERVVAGSHGQLALEVALLGAEHGREVEFSEMETGSSVFAEASHFPRSVVRKPLTTLDHLLAEKPEWKSPQCIKLDTQGYELEVLKGARRTLATVDVVLMEVSLVQINAGCPLFADVVAFMADAGFRPFDFCSQIRRRDGVLWQTDLLFIRSDGAIRVDPRLTPANW